MNRQNPLTLVTPVRSDSLEKLYDRLEKMKYELESNQHQLFERLGNIHYLRWLIIDDKDSSRAHSIFFKNDKNYKPKLVFSSNFDGSIKKHIKDLCSDKESELIDAIYECCEEYPRKDSRTPASRIAYFNKHRVKTSAFYKGSPGRTVKQIRREKKLRDTLKKLIDEGSWQGMGPREIHRHLREKIALNGEFHWLEKKYRMPRRNLFKLIPLILIFLLPVVVIVSLIAGWKFPVWLIILMILPFLTILGWVAMVQFFFENRDEYYVKSRSDLDDEKTTILEEYEDLGTKKIKLVDGRKKMGDHGPVYYQNQFSQLVDMKPGKVRLITFQAMMWLARTLISSIYVRGKLLGIPTIHFARWVLFDNNKRVLFFSNFDGSWQQYLGDFIDESGWGLTGIFSNTRVFPKSRFLGFTGIMAKKKFIKNSPFLFPGGAYDEEHFLAWSRDSELSTQVWYTAYPELSIKNVNNNSRLRVLFSKNLSERGAKKFFKLI